MANDDNALSEKDLNNDGEGFSVEAALASLNKTLKLLTGIRSNPGLAAMKRFSDENKRLGERLKQLDKVVYEPIKEHIDRINLLNNSIGGRMFGDVQFGGSPSQQFQESVNEPDAQQNNLEDIPIENLMLELKEEVAKLRGELLKDKQRNKQRGRRTISSKRVPHESTIGSLEKLNEIRNEAIENEGVAPAWMASCREAGIRPRTVRDHAPQLAKKWKDIDYMWPGISWEDLK